MGETLEYLESLYDSGNFEELENNSECLADWDSGIETYIIIKGKKVRL